MTARDYETIAACFERAANEPGNTNDPRTLADVGRRLALELELDNPRFNRARFLAACSIQED